MPIYPREITSPQLQKYGSVAVLLYSCFKNGWVTNKLFLKGLLHFKKFAKTSKDEPALLMVDNAQAIFQFASIILADIMGYFWN
jgi:hypothetical protein